MKIKSIRDIIPLAATALLVIGCQNGADSGKSNHSPGSSRGASADKIDTALAALSPEDRSLAKAQGKCPSSNQPLGTMGPPVKLTVEGQPVFICCEGCKDDVEMHAQAMLKKVAELKANNAGK